MKILTEDERAAALEICKQMDALRRGLAERDWPLFRHKKSGKVVKLMGSNQSWHAPSVEVQAVSKEPGKRHTRRVPVGALNFKRDYVPADAITNTPGPVDAGESAQALDVPLIKQALKQLSFQERVSLCNEAGLHFSYLEAVLNQPGSQQSSLTPDQFKQLVELAINRHPSVAQLLQVPAQMIGGRAASQLLDTMLKARYGFPENAPLPWQNFTPKAVREEAIVCIEGLLNQLGSQPMPLRAVVSEEALAAIHKRLELAQLFGPMNEPDGESNTLTQFYAHDVALLLKALGPAYIAVATVVGSIMEVCEHCGEKFTTLQEHDEHQFNNPHCPAAGA